MKKSQNVFMVWLAALAFAALVIFVPSTPARAGEIEDLEKKVEDLEKSHAELYHSLKEKKTPGHATGISDMLSIGGLVEIEGAYVDSELDKVTEADVVLATVELAIDADLSESVKGHILLLFEEGGTPLDVDEGTITLTAPYGLTTTLGKFYLPFGNFNSHFITDPQTLELGEINESAVMLGYATGPIEVSVGAFNGDVHKGPAGGSDDENIEDWFASVTVTPNENITFGVSYISDLADTDFDILGGGPYTEKDDVDGISAFISATFGPITIDAEYLGALDDFAVADLDLDLDGKGDEPTTFNLEVAFAVSDRLEVAAKVEGNDEFFGLPDEVFGVAASYELFEHTALTVEWLTGEYDTVAGEEVTIVGAQLGIEF